MGWWSTSIMGGDTPLDIEAEIFEICVDTDTEDELNAQVLEGNISQIVKTLREQEYHERKSVGFQVLGFTMMTKGATISPELKTEIIEWSKKDEWAEEDGERATIIQNFCNSLEIYDGRPVTINDEGISELVSKETISEIPISETIAIAKRDLQHAMEVMRYFKDVGVTQHHSGKSVDELFESVQDCLNTIENSLGEPNNEDKGIG